MKKILILNGPNLNFLGEREPSVYGTRSFDDFLEELRREHPGIRIDYFQSNHEGDLIDRLQEARHRYDGVIFNPAAYTHTSIALRDTVAAIKIPVAEVHISDISRREDFRKISYIRDVAEFTIEGKGLEGYREALLRLIEKY
jgi:3-dehydroquinate dehydratase-2